MKAIVCIKYGPTEVLQLKEVEKSAPMWAVLFCPLFRSQGFSLYGSLATYEGHQTKIQKFASIICQ